MVQEKPETGNTALHGFAKIGATREIDGLYKLHKQQFVEELNHRNKDGQTPLHFAYKYGHMETWLKLISYGADQNVSDKKGRTPKEVEGLGERE